MDPSRDASMVQELLSFKTNLDNTVTNSFHKEEQFAQTLKV